MPINYPLWFIRDLMVLVVFSPLVYLWAVSLRSLFLRMDWKKLLGGLTPSWRGLVSLSLPLMLSCRSLYID